MYGFMWTITDNRNKHVEQKSHFSIQTLSFMRNNPVKISQYSFLHAGHLPNNNKKCINQQSTKAKDKITIRKQNTLYRPNIKDERFERKTRCPPGNRDLSVTLDAPCYLPTNGPPFWPKSQNIPTSVRGASTATIIQTITNTDFLFVKKGGNFKCQTKLAVNLCAFVTT